VRQAVRDFAHAVAPAGLTAWATRRHSLAVPDGAEWARCLPYKNRAVTSY